MRPRAVRLGSVIGALAACCAAGTLPAAQAAGRGERLEPAGLWYCLVYGHASGDDWHISLKLDADGRASAAWGLRVGNRGWRPLSNWAVDEEIVTFADPDTGRRYEGDLGRSTLGGRWQADDSVGGWWCASRRAELAASTARLTRSDAAMAAPLVAQFVQAPDYPVQAVRQAKEGRAVVCFLVDRDGYIIGPEILELSDEIFREPTMQAISGSRFAVAEEPTPPRPGCRSYHYRLDVVR